jgi:hypothetical protein
MEDNERELSALPPASDPPEPVVTGSAARGGGQRLPRSQPARALSAAVLYAAAVAVGALVISMRTSGSGAVLATVLWGVALLVPFVVLGQRPGQPDRSATPDVPVLRRAHRRDPSGDGDEGVVS